MASSGSVVKGDPFECPLCQSRYNDADHEAKLLACHHSFCLACLLQVRDGRTTIKCPMCRKKTAMPSQGVTGLQTNFYISHMRGVLSPAKAEETVDNCSKHRGQPLLFFCETCSTPICMNCTVLDHEKSAGHVISDIASIISAYEEVIKSKMSNVSTALDQRRSKLHQLKQEMECLDVAKEVAMGKVKETFVQLRMRLDQRESILLKQAEELYKNRKNQIVQRAQVIKTESKKLNESFERMQTLRTGGSSMSVVQATADASQMADLDLLCKNIDLGDPVAGLIEFKFDEGLKPFLEATQKMGEVEASAPLPAVISIDIKSATTGLVSSLHLKVVDSNSQVLANCPVSVAIVDPEGDTLKCKMQDEGQTGHIVHFRPQLPGEHQVVTRFLKQPVEAAARSFMVSYNNPIQRIGEPGMGNGQMNKPTSVVVSPKGDIYVADMGNRRVQIFNPDGKLLSQFKVGSSKTTTYDLALNPLAEELYCTKVVPDAESGHMVADTLRAFDLNGEKKYQYQLKGTKNALFLAINSKGFLVVTDSKIHGVHIFNREGTGVKSFGSHGSTPGSFDFPSAICIGLNDSIIVSDTRNHRVQVFSEDGDLLHYFGSEGNGKGQFKSPRGITADVHGNILVADSHNRIQVFRHDGKYLSTIQSDVDPINEPYNMVATPEGFVYIADFKSCCIKKFRYI